ncbi:histidine phosphatase family protein [Acetobacter orleanensis]|uniref:Phosphoglycerate mutase n=1 Tax=Acetobacter orleanensis TaxID=104099 RepID=A0A4Y3TLC3_9PROT|nr:histidine phosphatase family protein [Acetobacter orleanensis]GAN68433.1 phosphoglycerate/bisphosphoglycerate mutase [Acetobacter orleanensis JCM 7639]GBR22732.1 hypothetical protein AA0473_0195 [Acetobacter orleanensis NRIC 0473]GEB82722.1 hypothetical protein AOR01nite_11990 [Acetobacter orleanensis]
MTVHLAYRTIRLVCLTTSLPDAITQGRIPPRETQSIAHIPAEAEAFSFPPLRTPLRFTHIILAEDCKAVGLPSDSAVPITRTTALKDRDYGTWHGQALRDLPSEALSALLQDMDFAPPEGESQRQFQERVALWLALLIRPEEGEAQAQPAAEGTLLPHTLTLLLITRPAVVRAIATHILHGSPEMAARLDIAPQTRSLFTHHAGLGRVRMLGAP